MASRAAVVEQFDQHLGRGGELLRRQEVEAAKAEFLAALELQSDDPKALGLLGLAYFQLGAFKDALPIYEKLVELHPDDASFWLNLGLVHLKLGKPDMAIIELGKSRELDPSQSRTVSYLGLAYARQGAFARAYEAFLQGREDELAREMERHLSAAERESIQRRVERRRAMTEGVAAEALLEAQGDDEDEHDDDEDEDEGAGQAVNGAGSSAAETAAEIDAEPPDELQGAIVEEPPPPLPPASPRAYEFDHSDEPVDDDQIEEISADELEEIEEVAAASAAEPSPASAQAPAGEPEPAEPLPIVEPAEPLPGPGSPRPLQAVEEPASDPEPEEPPPPPPPEPLSPDSVPLASAASWFSGAHPVPAPIEGLITQAVHRAEPAQSAQAAALKVAAGHEAPRSLSEFATSRLIRPEDGEHPFELAAGGELIVRVGGRVMSRTEHVVVSGGDLGYEPATKRVRGEVTDRVFGDEEHKLFVVTGEGFLVAAPGGGVFTAVALDDDILYIRENLVFAFEEVLSWENGNVPGSQSKIKVVQFRGSGCVALRSRRPLSGVKLATERILYVDADVLAGWVGRVVPRLAPPVAGGAASATFVECSGEGVVLIEDPKGCG
jgi:Flp pilus assembly protein TadD/uncharacterized protein (AIM24 family)